MNTRGEWPEGARFAFTVIDDTDNSTVQNVRPVYEMLTDLGFRVTKTVWVYPSRNHYTGQSLEDPDYLAFVRRLRDAGHEIALHNVGSGRFSREEILRGLDLFEELIGTPPRIHINHASNPDNLYWGGHRFNGPLRVAYDLFCRMRKREYGGVDPHSPWFWGDYAKTHVDYIRNLTFNAIDVLGVDPKIPYRRPGKGAYSNMWFSASDGHAIGDFNRLIAEENVDRLIDSGGACIAYTHFASGFVDERGSVNFLFRKRMEHLATLGGWFVPVSTLLDHLRYRDESRSVSRRYEAALQRRWLLDRLVKSVRSGRRGSFKAN